MAVWSYDGCDCKVHVDADGIPYAYAVEERTRRKIVVWLYPDETGDGEPDVKEGITEDVIHHEAGPETLKLGVHCRCGWHADKEPQAVLAESRSRQDAVHAVAEVLNIDPSAVPWIRSPEGGHEIVLPDTLDAAAAKDVLDALDASDADETYTKLTTPTDLVKRGVIAQVADAAKAVRGELKVAPLMALPADADGKAQAAASAKALADG